MRIAAVGTFWYPSKPYAGNFAIAGLKKLQNHVDIKIINLRAIKPGRKILERTEIEGFPVTHLSIPQIPGEPLISLALCKVLIPFIKPLIADCDLVQSLGCFPASGILFSQVCKAAGKHHLVQLVGADVNDVLKKYHSNRILKGWNYDIQAVASVCDDLLIKFRGYYPDVPNMRTIYRGVDINRFTSAYENRSIKGTGVRFLFLGGFPKFNRNYKGGELLRSLWKDDEEYFAEKNAYLTLAGSSTDDVENKLWRSALKYPERVTLLGSVDPVDIPNVTGSADVLLAPSKSEGLPNVIMESAASGIPVIATDVCGIPEVVINNETGIMLDNREQSVWQNAMRECCINTDRYREMGKAARTYMESKFNSDDYPQKIFDLYKLALNEPIRR